MSWWRRKEARDFLDFTLIHLPYDFFSNLNMSLTMDGVQLSSFKKTITMSNYHAIINMLNHTDAFMLGNKWQIEELSIHISTACASETVIFKSILLSSEESAKC